jgi:hypothetical protein
MQQLALSPLGHTWFLDLDGTLLAHNGHLGEDGDSLLPGAREFVDQIPALDLIVIVTAREEIYREATEAYLTAQGIRFDLAIFGAPFGERIVVNDTKPSGLQTAVAVNLARDAGPELLLRVDADA